MATSLQEINPMAHPVGVQFNPVETANLGLNKNDE